MAHIIGSMFGFRAERGWLPVWGRPTVNSATEPGSGISGKMLIQKLRLENIDREHI